MTDYMNRDEIIEHLTEYELKWLIENPTKVKEVAVFFAGGGFHNQSDSELQKTYSWQAPEKENQQ